MGKINHIITSCKSSVLLSLSCLFVDLSFPLSPFQVLITKFDKNTVCDPKNVVRMFFFSVFYFCPYQRKAIKIIKIKVNNKYSLVNEWLSQK